MLAVFVTLGVTMVAGLIAIPPVQKSYAASIPEKIRERAGSIEDDVAKKQQNIQDAIKDASSKNSDFVNSFNDLARQIGGKITP